MILNVFLYLLTTKKPSKFKIKDSNKSKYFKPKLHKIICIQFKWNHPLIFASCDTLDKKRNTSLIKDIAAKVIEEF